MRKSSLFDLEKKRWRLSSDTKKADPKKDNLWSLSWRKRFSRNTVSINLLRRKSKLLQCPFWFIDFFFDSLLFSLIA